jgi:hypothetical protein
MPDAGDAGADADADADGGGAVVPLPASGPLAPWPGGAMPAADLPSHALTYAPSPLDTL